MTENTPRSAMSPERLASQAERILDWLRQFGFSYNPFEYTNSERDPNLEEHFVEYADFDFLLALHNRVYFARTGDGKTATRLRLQSYYRDTVGGLGIFAFSYLIPQNLADNPPKNFDGHLTALLTSAVRHAFILLALRGIDLEPLRRNEVSATAIAKIQTYFTAYYGLVNTWREDLEHAVANFTIRKAIENLSPIYDDLEAWGNTDSINVVWLRQWIEKLNAHQELPLSALAQQPLARWQEFCLLLNDLGIQQLLILLDNVDTKPSPELYPHANEQLRRGIPALANGAVLRMVDIIRPIIVAAANKSLGNNAIWQFFLPNELYLPLTKDLSNGIEHTILEWNKEKLHRLLQLRLAAATGGAISTLLQIAENDFPSDIETFAAIESNWSPRYLVHFINRIFGVHVDSAPQGTLPGKLSCKTLAQVPHDYNSVHNG